MPARVSYVQDVGVDLEIVPILPAMMELLVECSTRLDNRHYNAARIPLVRFIEILDATVTEDGELILVTPSLKTTFELMARGDMNGDGLEDLVIFAIAGATGGTAIESETFLVTRDRPKGALYVADADSPRYVCKNYRRRQ